MEMAYYCTECNAANLIDYHNREFVGSCFNCGAPINLQQTDSLCVNTIIGERYQIRELLEETSINNLYVATDLVTSNLVILRIFCWDFSYSISDPEDFLNTVDSVGSIAVPTHVELVDWGVNEDLMFTVWPCENIETLTRLLKHHTSFEPEIALSICREIAVGLENIYFETGIGHYNLSADVVYLDGQGHARFSDAGHAAYLFYDEHFQDADFNIFNSHYVSPEVAFSWSFPDIRSDMYSLGCCLYAMVTGKLPFGHRGPQNENDYSKFSLTKPDEFRLGETFCRIFYGLTEVNPDDRFQTWREVIKLMESYLQEEKMLKKSSLSGKRRSLTTSYNFDLYEDIDENLAKKTRAKKRRKKKKALSSSDIRVRMRSEAPVSKVRSRSAKGIRKKNRKSDNTTLLIVASVMAVLGIVLFAILASKFSHKQEDLQAKATEAKVEPVSKKSNSSSTISSPVKTKQPVKKTTLLDTENIPLTEEDEYKELTFEIREYTIRKEWDRALALCELYSGPYDSQVTKLKTEIEKKKMSYLQAQLDKSIVKEPAGVTDQPLDGNGTLEELVEKIYIGQYTTALELLPYVENVEKINLSMEKSSLEDLGVERLKDLIGRGYDAEVGREVSLNVEGNDFKGTLQQVSRINGSLKIKVNYLSRKLERIYSFNLINPLDNLQRIKKDDPEEESFTRFLYLLQHKLYDQALDSLSKYNGALRLPLTSAMKNIQNDKAQSKWLELTRFMSLDNEFNDNGFVESFKFVHLKGGDTWVAKWLMEDFITKYGLSSFYEENKSRIALLQSFILKSSTSVKEPSLVVSADGRAGTVSFLKAVREVESGGLIRVLPGEYSGNLIVDRKVQIIGASGVRYSGNISLDDDRIHLEHIKFNDGYVELHRKVRDVKLNWLHFSKSGIKLRGDNSFIQISNCLIRGLNLSSCRQVNIIDSVLLDSDANNRYAINGFLSGSLVNSIIFSQNGFAMKMHEKADSTLLVKYCLVYGKKGLVTLTKDKTTVLDEDDFNRSVGRLVNSEIIAPQFVNSAIDNYKLKDLTPGFFTGEDKKAIGIQYSYKNQE